MGINLFEVLRVYPNLFESEEAKAAYLSADDATNGHMLSTRLFKKLVERTDELTALKKRKDFYLPRSNGYGYEAH